MNRYISKSYTTSKNTIDRQYTERGQLQCQLLLVVSIISGGVKKLIVPKVATTTFGHLFPLGTLCQMKQEALLIFNTSKLCVKQTTFKKQLDIYVCDVCVIYVFMKCILIVLFLFLFHVIYHLFFGDTIRNATPKSKLKIWLID